MRYSLTTENGSCGDMNGRACGYCLFCVMLAPRGALTICQVPFLPGGEVGAAWEQMRGPGALGYQSPLIPGLGCICAGG